MSRSTISSGDDNPILRASLWSGTLSIKVIDMDIRRDVSHLQARIETDYILQVNIGAEVDIHSKTKLCETFQRVQEMDEYFCSKRYVDVRQLAHSIRGHAEDIVKCYAVKPKSKGSSLHSAMKKASQAVRYINNTECTSSPTRSSETLDQSSPSFVRVVLVGVDEFCEEIHSVKRQRGMKYSWSYVKSMSERRKATINRAFTLLIQALYRADLSSVSEKKPETIPVPLKSLIRSLETFLLTDVIIDLETKETMFPQNATKIPASIENSSDANPAPKPLTMRHRSSFVDRMAEERSLQEVAHILLSDEIEWTEKVDDGVAESAKYSSGTENWGIEVPTTQTRLLPYHPTNFGIIVAVGVTFFKAIEGRVLNVQLDLMAMFGFVCGLLGRQWTLHVQKGVVVASHQPKPKEKEKKTPESPRPRPTMHRVSGSISHSTQQAHRFSLIQKSLRHLGVISKDTETSVVHAKTFPKFPDGAAIGSHHNCWSSPPSENFHVRGPTYLKDKAKVPSANYIFPCRGCDLFLTDNAPINVGRNRSIFGGKLRDVPTFIINYRLPWGIFVSYHEIPERFLPFLRRGNGYGDLKKSLPSLAGMSAGERAMCNFLLCDKDMKNKAWKLVPVVVDGPWVVKRVVGGKPAIVGTKLPITYVYQPPEKGLAEYFEADLDIVSSAAARNVLAVVRSYTQVLTIDLGYVVQGSTKEELPEQMMLGLRLHGLDPLTAELLPDFENVSTLTFPDFDGDSGNETD